MCPCATVLSMSCSESCHFAFATLPFFRICYTIYYYWHACILIYYYYSYIFTCNHVYVMFVITFLQIRLLSSSTPKDADCIFWSRTEETRLGILHNLFSKNPSRFLFLYMIRLFIIFFLNHTIKTVKQIFLTDRFLQLRHIWKIYIVKIKKKTC